MTENVRISSDDEREASRVVDMPGRDNEVTPEIHPKLLWQASMRSVVGAHAPRIVE